MRRDQFTVLIEDVPAAEAAAARQQPTAEHAVVREMLIAGGESTRRAGRVEVQG